MRIKLIAISVFILIIAIGFYSLIQYVSTEGNIVYGVNPNYLNNVDSEYAKEAGFTWVRTDIGSYQFPYILQESQSFGFKVLGIIDYATIQGNFTLAQWNETVLSIVEQYGAQISAWEIWNEPLIYKQGFQNGSAWNYFLMVKSAYIIIHKYYNTPVIGLGGIGFQLNNTANAFQWLSELFSYGLNNYVNALSLHLYPGNYPLISAETAYASIIEYIHTKSTKNIWVTETGMQDSGNQTAYINTIYPFLISEGITHIFWYNLVDGNVPNNEFGLLTSNEQPKSSYYTMKTFIENNK
jgi:hypothetical protein